MQINILLFCMKLLSFLCRRYFDAPFVVSALAGGRGTPRPYGLEFSCHPIEVGGVGVSCGLCGQGWNLNFQGELFGGRGHADVGVAYLIGDLALDVAFAVADERAHVCCLVLVYGGS